MPVRFDRIDLGEDKLYQGVEIFTPKVKVQVEIDQDDVRIAVICPDMFSVLLRNLGSVSGNRKVYDVYVG